MLLKDLLKVTGCIRISGSKNADITDISFDSRKTKPCHLFIAIDGVDDDGHKYIGNAVSNGAVAIVVTKDFEYYADKYPDVSVIETDDVRIFLAKASAYYFNYPANALNLIGITGTKGKSTISYMIKNIFDKARTACAVIGTVGAVYKDKEIAISQTTPSAYELNEIFSKINKESVNNCVMEVSSIALKQNRVYGLRYKIGMYTNLTQAHITDREHPDFSDYYNSKKRMFSASDIMIVNNDDKYVRKAAKEYKSSEGYNKDKHKIYTIGIEEAADITADNILYRNDGSSFIYRGLGMELEIELDMPGRFNIYNSLFAVTACLLNDIDVKYIRQGLSDVVVKGRCEKVDTGKDFTVMIDYAHTPDSLEKLLIAVRETRTSGRIICLFGCGGDRDKSMRPMMGKIAGQNADFSIITSDNSRTEKPEDILFMIEQGIKETDGEYICITDRTEAISYALRNAKKDDLIILAGKGHETYMDVMGKKTHYDEREIIQKVLKGEI